MTEAKAPAPRRGGSRLLCPAVDGEKPGGDLVMCPWRARPSRGALRRYRRHWREAHYGPFSRGEVPSLRWGGRDRRSSWGDVFATFTVSREGR